MSVVSAVLAQLITGFWVTAAAEAVVRPTIHAVSDAAARAAGHEQVVGVDVSPRAIAASTALIRSS